jgi:hypothetical protein
VICGQILESQVQNADKISPEPAPPVTGGAGQYGLGICGQAVHGLCKPIYESNQLFNHYSRF